MIKGIHLISAVENIGTFLKGNIPGGINLAKRKCSVLLQTALLLHKPELSFFLEKKTTFPTKTVVYVMCNIYFSVKFY